MSDVKDQTIELNVHLKPSESSAHPRATNYTNVGVAQGIAYVDFGFIEPALARRHCQDGEGWAGRAERIGRCSRHPRGDERGRARAIASADSTSLGRPARGATEEIKNIGIAA